MSAKPTFDEILDAVELLPSEAQAELADIIRRRLAAQRRQEVLDDARQAEKEFLEGKTRPASVDDLMSEIDS